jgi:hypothetical protein
MLATSCRNAATGASSEVVGVGRRTARAVAQVATLIADARPQGGLPIEIHFPLIPFAMPR